MTEPLALMARVSLLVLAAVPKHNKPPSNRAFNTVARVCWFDKVAVEKTSCEK